MMSYSRKFLLLVAIVLLSTKVVFCQTAGQDTSKMLIKNFLFDLYKSNKKSLDIAKHYVSLQEGPNEFSSDARYQKIAEHLAMLRQGQAVGQSTEEANMPILFDEQVNKIVPYNETNKSILNISLPKSQEKEIYVITKNDKPIRYFVVKGKYISSFDYMVKGVGGPAYFIAY